MDHEELDRVSTDYSIHTDAENGRRDSDGKGFAWRSTVSNRSMLSRRSFAIGKEKLSSCKALFLVAFIGVAVALMSLPAVIHPFLVCNLLLSMKWPNVERVRVSFCIPMQIPVSNSTVSIHVTTALTHSRPASCVCRSFERKKPDLVLPVARVISVRGHCSWLIHDCW